MTTGLTLSILIALLLGTLSAQLAWPPEISLRTHLLLRVIIGTGLGFGVTSLLLFLWLLVFGSLSGGYLLLEMVSSVCALSAFVYLRNKPRAPPFSNLFTIPDIMPQFTRLTAAAFFISAGCIFTTAVVTLVREPHGQGDAVAIWNLHARFILRGGGYWGDAIANQLVWSHADYPLLIPLSVARCWAYAGETQIAPALIALIFTFGTVGLLVSTTSLLRTRSQGYLAGLVLLEPFIFFRAGTYEYADVPLGFFLLAAFVLFYLKDTTPGDGYGLLVLSGMMAGFAAWTKNEGSLFLVSIVVARFAAVVPFEGLKTYLNQMIYFLAGTVPILLFVLYFKLELAPINDLVAGQDLHATAERLVNFSRYTLILRAIVSQFTGFRKWYAHPTYMLLIYPWFLGVKANRRDRTTLITLSVGLSLILAGYFFIYVTTPRDLEWHLRFSLDRLLIQVWPAFVLLYFLLVRSPEEALVITTASAKSHDS
jgi:hypothetical protein